MPKKETTILLSVVTILVGVLVAWGIYDGRSPGTVEGVTDAAIVYYYGAECPHCKVVAEFLEENKIAEKVDFAKKEVWHDATNSRELETRTKQVCGLESDEIGVPLVIGDDKCFIGEDDVMNFFKEKAGIK